MIESVPLIIEPTYWLGGWSPIGDGPVPFGPAPSPLAFATNSVPPSPETAIPVGYQAVGINPATFPAGKSTTATSLSPALATYSRLPSGARASAFGLAPTSAPG